MIRVEKTMFHAADGLLKKILIDLMKGIFLYTNNSKWRNLRMKKILVFMMVLVMAVSLVACGGDSAKETKEPINGNGSINDDETINDTDAPIVKTIDAVVFNETSINIKSISTSPADSNKWKQIQIPNVLMMYESIETEFGFTDDSLICDILIDDGNGNQITFRNVNFAESSSDIPILVLYTTEGGGSSAYVN